MQDVLFSAPPCSNDAKSADCVGSGTASNTCNEVSNHQTEAKGSGVLNAKSVLYFCMSSAMCTTLCTNNDVSSYDEIVKN